MMNTYDTKWLFRRIAIMSFKEILFRLKRYFETKCEKYLLRQGLCDNVKASARPRKSIFQREEIVSNVIKINSRYECDDYYKLTDGYIDFFGG